MTAKIDVMVLDLSVSYSDCLSDFSKASNNKTVTFEEHAFEIHTPSMTQTLMIQLLNHALYAKSYYVLLSQKCQCFKMYLAVEAISVS